MRSSLNRVALPALLVSALTGCGLVGPDTYELGEKSVKVEKGEEFTLSVPVDTAMGEHWDLTSPDPAAAVVRSTGKEQELDGDDGDVVGGSSGTDYFKFKAVGTGTTKIRLIECPSHACVGGEKGSPVVPSPVPSGSEPPAKRHRAIIHTYTVTVK